MENRTIKVNRGHAGVVIAVGIVALHLLFAVRVVTAEYNPALDIINILFPSNDGSNSSGGTGSLTTTPVPCTNVTNEPGGGQWGLYPYVQFGLDYHIALRDTSVQPRSDLRERLQDGGLPVGRNAKLEYIDTIISTAVSNQWNPAFMLSLWLEETGGSHYTIRPYGNAYPWQRHGNSHFGYYPFGPPRPVTDELRWFNTHLGTFDNTRFANFMARFSGGGCMDTNGDGIPDGGTAVYYNNICTLNPFANNPNFLRNLKSVYNFVVPPGTHGALTLAGQGNNVPCPSGTPVTGAPPTTSPTSTPGTTGGGGSARDVIEEVRSDFGEPVACSLVRGQPRSCIEINRSNVNTLMNSLSSAGEGFKDHIRISAANYGVLQCVRAAYALGQEIFGKIPLRHHNAACRYTDTVGTQGFYSYGTPGVNPQPGDFLVWNSSGGRCDPDSRHYGHIAFVISVYDSENVVVGEGSWGRPGNLAVRTVNLTHYPPRGWLHFQ